MHYTTSKKRTTRCPQSGIGAEVVASADGWQRFYDDAEIAGWRFPRTGERFFSACTRAIVERWAERVDPFEHPNMRLEVVRRLIRAEEHYFSNDNR